MSKLNPRQRKILDLLIEGQRDKQIADRLGMKQGALRKSIYHIVNGLEAHTRCQAVAIYLDIRTQEDDDFPT